jgi:cytoskeleton protein RodZ
MAPESNQDTFGSYLKSFRHKRELAIETVADATRIAVHCLKAMEADAHDRLPPPAYVKSFIRSYAQAVGANADVALNLYLSDLEHQATTRRQHLKRRAKLGALRRTWMTAGLIVCILLLVRYSDIFFDPAAPPHAEAIVETALPLPSTIGPAGADSRPAPKAPQEKLQLKVIAVEKTWLKVIVDAQNARSYDLKPEEILELEGNQRFNLMIGNATGLQIFLNGQPVKIFGGSGQVVSLNIP